MKDNTVKNELSDKIADFKSISTGTIRLGLIGAKNENGSGNLLSLYELGDFWFQNKGFFTPQNWYLTLNTEENVGLDTNGRFYERNEPVVVVVQGEGLLANKLLEFNSLNKNQHLNEGAVRYSQESFDSLLKGILPSGKKIKLYDFMQAQANSFSPEGNFGVILPYDLARNTKSGIHSEDDLLRNVLAITRAGGKQSLKKIYSAFAPKNPVDLYHQRFNLDEGIGNFHALNNSDPSIPQGRLLYLVNNKYANKKLGIYGTIGFNEPANFIFSKN